MKMRLTCSVLAIAAGLAAVALPLPAMAADTLSRIVSRANCLVPLPKLSLIEAYGFTFNESIGWDPMFWRQHRAIAQSNHYRSTFWGGFWSDYLLSSHLAGSFVDTSWRIWAGTIDRGDTRELPNPHLRPVRWVAGNHWEILDGMSYPLYRQSGAMDCNLSSW